MSGTDQNTPAGKPGRRNRKAERSQKPGRQQSPKPDQPQHAKEQIDATAAPADTAPIQADTATISFQTIANAYGDYTRKTLEETRSFVDKLTGVRSLDKVMEVQTEFAKQTYRTFVAESQKIRELHSELARQTLKPLQGIASKTTQDPH